MDWGQALGYKRPCLAPGRQSNLSTKYDLLHLLSWAKRQTEFNWVALLYFGNINEELISSMGEYCVIILLVDLFSLTLVLFIYFGLFSFQYLLPWNIYLGYTKYKCKAKWLTAQQTPGLTIIKVKNRLETILTPSKLLVLHSRQFSFPFQRMHTLSWFYGFFHFHDFLKK